MTEILAWPVEDDFPQEILLDNQQKLSSSKVEHDMESGLPFARLRDTVNFSTWTCQIFLESDDQRERFIDFWQHETKNGTVPFLWHDPLTGVAKTYRLEEVTSLAVLGGGRHIAAFIMREVPE